MAIAPPSDLILDVARAADPSNLRESTGRLRTIAASSSGQGFDLAFSSASNRAEAAFTSFKSAGAASIEIQRSPGEKFEAMILTQFVETMLPENAEAVFGEGTTGEIWKSMLAEQVAGQLAASGGVGIADLISDTVNKGVKA